MMQNVENGVVWGQSMSLEIAQFDRVHFVFAFHSSHVPIMHHF